MLVKEIITVVITLILEYQQVIVLLLKKQIDIVKPKVIVTLGYYPLLLLLIVFGFKIEENLQKTFAKSTVILAEDYIIIPLYHSVAQIKREMQLEMYSKIWDYI